MTEVVIDTSAVVAILDGEPASEALIEQIEASERRLMSTATLVELTIVMESRHGPAGSALIERFLRDGEVVVVPVERPHAARAIDGWRTFGKGRHAAALNLGDCFTYGLAAELGAPVLCTGRDFARTDVAVVP